jgi:hypothetical protein
MNREISSFSDLPSSLQARILREVQPADPAAWVHEPIPALGGRAFLDLYRQGDDASVERYLAEVHGLLHPGSARRSDPARTPLMIRPSFRSPLAALGTIARVPLALLVVGVVGIERGSSVDRALRLALVFSLGVIVSAVYTVLARIEARPDGTLIRHFAAGPSSRRYRSGAIERVRLSDADVTNPRWRASAAFIGPLGEQRFRLYLNYWSPHDIALLAGAMGYELFDERAGATRQRTWVAEGAGRTPWRPGTGLLAGVVALSIAACAGLVAAGARL